MCKTKTCESRYALIESAGRARSARPAHLPARVEITPGSAAVMPEFRRFRLFLERELRAMAESKATFRRYPAGMRGITRNPEFRLRRRNA